MHRKAAIVELVRAFDHYLAPLKFHDDISNGSRVIVLTIRHTRTDTTENVTTFATLSLRSVVIKSSTHMSKKTSFDFWGSFIHLSSWRYHHEILWEQDMVKSFDELGALFYSPVDFTDASDLNTLMQVWCIGEINRWIKQRTHSDMAWLYSDALRRAGGDLTFLTFWSLYSLVFIF